MASISRLPQFLSETTLPLKTVGTTPSPSGGRFFFSCTGLSHLFWVYEQRPGTEVMCVYRQLVISRQIPNMGVWHNNRAVTWQLYDEA